MHLVGRNPQQTAIPQDGVAYGHAAHATAGGRDAHSTPSSARDRVIDNRDVGDPIVCGPCVVILDRNTNGTAPGVNEKVVEDARVGDGVIDGIADASLELNVRVVDAEHIARDQRVLDYYPRGGPRLNTRIVVEIHPLQIVREHIVKDADPPNCVVAAVGAAELDGRAVLTKRDP